MARDIRFNNVAVPSLGANVANLGINTANKGFEQLQDVVSGFQKRAIQQQEVQEDLDLDALRSAAREQLGGQQAGETLEDYNASIDEFLAENTNLTEAVGQKSLTAFRDQFKSRITEERDTQENRDITLEQRARSKVLEERSDAEFERKTAIRKENQAAREHSAGHEQRRRDAKAKFLADPSSLSDEDLALLDTTQSINQLEEELSQFTGADSQVLSGFVSDATTRAQRAVFSPEEATKLAIVKRDEQRRFNAGIAELAVQRSFDKIEFEKFTDRDYSYGAGDQVAANEQLIAGLTLKNGGEPPSDDILEEMRVLLTDYQGQGAHLEDIVGALILSVESKDSVLFWDFDESIPDEEDIASIIEASSAARINNARQARLARLGQNRPAAATPAVAEPVVEAAPPPAVTPAADPVLSVGVGDQGVDDDFQPGIDGARPGGELTASQVASLTAAAAELEPGQPESALTQAEEEKALEINVTPVNATSPKELKVIAINQLNATEMPKVEANLEEAIEKMPRNSANTTTAILRRELLTKLGALRNRIKLFEEDQSAEPTLNLPIPNQ